MTKIRANPLLGPLEGGFARCHLGAQKFSIFRDPPSNGPYNGRCPHQNHYVPRHINNSYIVNMNSLCSDNEVTCRVVQKGTSANLTSPPPPPS